MNPGDNLHQVNSDTVRFSQTQGAVKVKDRPDMWDNVLIKFHCGVHFIVTQLLEEQLEDVYKLHLSIFILEKNKKKSEST